MKVLIKQAKIIAPSSPFNGQTKDIFITNGIITTIADGINDTADVVVDEPNLHVSTGWMDCFAHFCDPGYEYKETLETGANAAAAGGFTDVMVLPNTAPVVHNKSQVEYIVQKSKALAVNIHPIGAITKNTEGKELAEMYDMHQSGAAAFGDGIHSLQSAGILLKALQYVKSFDGTIIQIPEDKSIGANGLINEGIVSTQLGLPGKPAIAEEIQVARDIKLARYTESKLHFTGVSSAKSLEYIKRAKEGGIQVSCSVTPYHLFFTDEDMKGYDTNLKVNPPLRTSADRTALLEALANGTIDGIASHHIPQNWDNKTCEFEYAKDGMTGLESLFGVLRAVTDIPLEQIIGLLSTKPRTIFGLPVPAFSEGSPAVLTLFNPDFTYTFDAGMIQSKSANNAFVGKTLRGKVTGIINKEKVVLQ
ncbi:MAG: dihydroorotase [Bacteroidetes bacterium]|nr:dihydroorotase [Bacteroidota bacterium]